MGWIGGGCRAEIGDGLGGAMMGTCIELPMTFHLRQPFRSHGTFPSKPILLFEKGGGMDQWKDRRESINGRIGGATRGDGDRSEICGSLCGRQSSFHSIFFLLQCDANGPGNESGL